MKATTISYIIAYAGLYSIILPVLVVVYRYRYLQGPTLIFAGLQVVALGIVVFSTVFTKQNNSYLSFIDTGIDALAISLMYAPLMPTQFLKRAVGWFGPLFALGIVADYVWWEGPAQLGDSIAGGIECLFIAGIFLIYLRQVFDNPQINSLRRYPMFLITIALLAHCIVVAPVYFFIQPLMSYSMTLAMRAYDLMFTISFLSHILVAIAFWFTKVDADVVALRLVE